MKNYGFNVEIKYKNGSKEVRNNVTEIHYRYADYKDAPRDRVAFESDVHGTGGTVEISEIIEFETVLAKKKEKSY